MGLGNIIKGFFNEAALGDSTIETIQTMFLRVQRQQPNEEPHAWLASIWLVRMKAWGRDISNPDIALVQTYLHACIKPPLCARSLGLHFLYKENPRIIEKYPNYAKEYASLMGPVLKAQEDGTIDQLYRRYNPKMSEEMHKES